MNTAAPLTRRVALCIDDFGLHQGVDEATLRLAELGRVTAVSCMTGAPHWSAAAAQLAAVADAIDVGLHLDFTEHALTPGMRMRLPVLLARTQARLVDPRRLRGEIDAQLDAFEGAFGRPPAHVDGHQHVHQFPVIRDVLFEALLARAPAQRPWVRCTRQPRSAGAKAWLIEQLGARRFCALADQYGFGHNARLLGVYDFQGDTARYRLLLGQWLAQARGGDLLMCHPASGPGAHDTIAAARQREYAVLASDGFAELLHASHVQLARLGGVLATG